MNGRYVWKNRYKKFLDNPKAIIPFFKKRLYYNFIADKQLQYYADFHYLDYAQTIDEIIDNNKSIVRFGDEVFDMLQGIGLYYGNWRQRYDPDLAQKLQEVLASRGPNLLVCFNPEFILKDKNWFKKEGIPEQYHFWTNSKMFLKDYYHKDMTYGSALCFTPRYNTKIDYDKLKNFFQKKNVIIVTSKIKRFENIQLGKTISFIEAPENDAWQEYENIKKAVLAMAEKSGKIDTLIMVSMGPAAKILVHEMTKHVYAAWDTGQFFDLAFKEIQKNS